MPGRFSCVRTQRDDTLVPHIERVWQANMRVIGACKVWKQMSRDGLSIARYTVERLMRRLGLQGVRRGEVVRTTISGAKLPCPRPRTGSTGSSGHPPAPVRRWK